MPYTEYVGWMKYFNMQPEGLKEDIRTALLMQTTYQGKSKLDVDKFFPTIQHYKKIRKKDSKTNPFVNFVVNKGKKKGINFNEE